MVGAEKVARSAPQQAISADRSREGLRFAEGSPLGRRSFTPFGRGGRSL